ncbi:MAG: DEAD/DEAH box helicase [Thermoguttaceae bacterium]|nr:DEAD/DEAH box helicase [Thermoguttaceae bacterium]
MTEYQIPQITVRSWNHRSSPVEVSSMLFGNDATFTTMPNVYSFRKPTATVPVKVFAVPVKKCKIPVRIKSWYFTPVQNIEFSKTNTEPSPQTAANNAPSQRPHGTDTASENSPARPDTQQTDLHNGQNAFRELPNDPTRIRVPDDVIKIEDRLGYILQPPLESLLAMDTLEMPFEPFTYQKQGVGFLYSSHFAILADEMGLGKTMQAITTIRLLLRTGECRRILLVCPKPLVTNWKREFELWAPEIPIQVIEGKGERRQWLWQDCDVPVRIANYELLQRDRELFELPESCHRFDLVVLDESQRIKNKSSGTSEAARAIPRKRSWALTGTPVENSSEDLVGIFEFLSPGFLESGLKPSRVCRIVGDHILRRTKDMVLKDLPPKLIRDAHIELEGEQWETYRLAQEAGEIRLNEMGDSVTLHHAFELIMRLKQICNFDPVTGQSAKIERLLADLDEVVQSGRKAIIFSQWVETLLTLKDRLRQFHPLEYHGRIPSKNRDQVINTFRNDPDRPVILMSYGAGSVGLNLQFAQYVFLFDRWWNPAVEDQAINRAHRIGAAGPVTVSRFVCVDTIEEKIDRILEEKRLLSDTILSGAQGLNCSRGLTQDDIFSLFNLKRKPDGPPKE